MKLYIVRVGAAALPGIKYGIIDKYEIYEFFFKTAKKLLILFGKHRII